MKHLNTLITLLAAMLLPAVASAQQAVGSWQLYNNFTSSVTHMLDTPHKVYMVSDGNLFSYDKDTEELNGHTTLNSLSDNVVTHIVRNYDKNYVVVFYQSGNIDILYDNGDVANLPDVKDAQSVASKNLYDVAFDGDKMYVATGFGLVLYDVKRASVKESGIYNLPVYGVTVIGNKVLTVVDGTFYTFDLGARFTTLSHLTPVAPTDMRQLEALTDNLFFASQRGAGVDFAVCVFDADNNTIAESWRHDMPAQQPAVRQGDHIMVFNPYGIFDLYPDASKSNGYDMPYYPTPADARYNNLSAYATGYTSGNRIWYANARGLGSMSHNGSYGDMSVNSTDMIKPFGTNIDTGVAGITPGRNGLYLYNRAASRSPRYNYYTDLYGINYVDNGFISDITPATTIDRIPQYARKSAPQRVVEDPVDPSVFYYGSWFEGVRVNRNGTDIAKFDWRNTPADSTWCFAALDIAFDPSNNLWVNILTMTRPYLMVLPADKRMSPDVKASDWLRIDIGALATDMRTRDFNILPLRAPKNRNTILFADGFDPNTFAVLNTGGNVTSTTGHTSRATDKFVDQDSKTFGPVYVTTMVEDNNGSVWVGTRNGVFAIHNPAQFVKAGATVERIKVPRNDGTSLADYLLDNQVVTSMAVDGANRKWLGTESSGVYLVSADGREIISNFNTSNSPLPSNTIKAIGCEPDGNRVYIATSAGLASYSSTAAPAEETYDNVYAYPNPVRPDYSGWITITGLVDGSLVKITDPAGNVMYQTKSDGGMVTWNGCAPSGHRVRSGVYYVFASGTGDSSSGGKVVTKILVVN